MPYVTDLEAFLIEQESRVHKYYSTNRSKLVGFENKERFINWYLNQLKLQDNKCHYCQTSILDIRKLLNANVILGRRVSGNGLRGPNFEVDKMDPFGKYDEDNCVLSCYYCNNDKSNTFGYEIYKDVIGPVKKQIWDILLSR